MTVLIYLDEGVPSPFLPPISRDPIAQPVEHPPRPHDYDSLDDLLDGLARPTLPIIGRTGSVVMYPHGTPFTHSMFGEGIRYVVQTHLLFHKFTQKDQIPYPIPATLSPVNYRQMYLNTTPDVDRQIEHILDCFSPDVKKPIEPTVVVDTFRDVLALQIEDLKKRFPCPANGLNQDTFPVDTWTNILAHLTVKDIIPLLSVSKNINQVVYNSDFWRASFRENFPAPEFLESFGVLPFLLNWYERYKRVNLVLKHKVYCGTCVDFGSSKLKYVGYNGKTKTVTMGCVDALVTLVPPKEPSIDFLLGGEETQFEAKLGEGVPLLSSDQKKVECVLKSLATGERVCIILPPRESVSRSQSFVPQYRYCEASNATVAFYNQKSGVVISIGALSTWIEIVLNHKVMWNFVSPDPSIPLIPRLEELIKAFVAFKAFEADQNPHYEEFYCIGGHFDESAIQAFQELMSDQGLKWTIMSKMENRIMTPVIGALLSEERNYNYHYEGNWHLMTENPNFVPPADDLDALLRDLGRPQPHMQGDDVWDIDLGHPSDR